MSNASDWQLVRKQLLVQWYILWHHNDAAIVDICVRIVFTFKIPSCWISGMEYYGNLIVV
jgi:hypothetical protein